ncbi:MAG: DUF1254 domain-containing protein [Pseudomonadota bacterium]
MKQLFIATLLLVLSFVIGHITALIAVPSVIMDTAMDRMQERGLKHHQFTLSPRTTPQTQTVVRPSPDLAYSVCLFELSGNDALRIQTGTYDRYTSVSFFDDRTNNFATVRVSSDEGADIVLLAPGRARLGTGVFEGQQIEAPSQRGLILIRRLAPTENDYARVVEASAADRCATLERSSDGEGSA